MKSMPFMWKRESTLVKAKPIGLPFEEMLQMANITPASSLSPKLEKGPLSRIVHFDFETQPYTKYAATPFSSLKEVSYEIKANR
jgi:hypothetical protein